MKNLKLHTIIFGAIYALCSTPIHGMENNSYAQQLMSATASVASAAHFGLKRIYYGNAGLLEHELDHFESTKWNEVSAANLVNRASDELKNDPSRAAKLLNKIKNHNALHPTMPYNVDDTARANLKTAIERHYKAKELLALDETEDQTQKLLKDFRKQYQAIIFQSQIHARELNSIAEMMEFTKSQKPDQNALGRNLAAKYHLPENLLELLTKPENEEFDILESVKQSGDVFQATNTDNTIESTTHSSSSSSSSNNNTNDYSACANDDADDNDDNDGDNDNDNDDLRSSHLTSSSPAPATQTITSSTPLSAISSEKPEPASTDDQNSTNNNNNASKKKKKKKEKTT